MLFFVIENVYGIHYLESSPKEQVENSISKDDSTAIPLIFLLLASSIAKCHV